MGIEEREHLVGGVEIELVAEDDSVLVRAFGEIDLASAMSFETDVRQAIRNSGSGVILDLDGVTFIDSMGLRALLSVATLSHMIGRQLRILRASEQVRQVIELSGVADLLPLAD